jgi:hypothetical protein
MSFFDEGEDEFIGFQDETQFQVEFGDDADEEPEFNELEFEEADPGQQLVSGFRTGMGGMLKEDRKTEMYNAELKSALQNREIDLVPMYYDKIVYLPNYTKLNPQLLADVLDKYSTNSNPTTTQLKNILTTISSRPAVSYSDADVLRYWRFVSKRF